MKTRRYNGRAIAGFFVVALHVLFLAVLAFGLNLSPIRTSAEKPVLVVDLTGSQTRHSAVPQIPTLSKPDVPDMPAPDIAIDNSAPTNAMMTAGDAGATVPAEAIGADHGAPHLSDALLQLARRALLRLRLSIAADGSVNDAGVESSSGSPEVDAIAVAWVKAHWRYKPALREGQPIAVTTTALVAF